MAKHTPGPWHFEAGRIWQRGDNPQPIAYADTYPDEIEREANARLIAAAPELLAALDVAARRITELCRAVCVLSGNPKKARAEDYALEIRAAIRKATD